MTIFFEKFILVFLILNQNTLCGYSKDPFLVEGFGHPIHILELMGKFTQKQIAYRPYSLLIVAPIMGFCSCSMFYRALLCVHSSFAINKIGKRELDALLSLSSWCLAIVVWLFLTVP